MGRVPMFARVRVALGLGLAVLTAGVVALSPMPGHAAAYQVFVTNEKSGDVTVIDGGDYKVLATIPVGKRPRGIHASPRRQDGLRRGERHAGIGTPPNWMRTGIRS